MTSLSSSESLSQQEATEAHDHHGDFRMFGLATFLVADGMTFAGFSRRI